MSKQTLNTEIEKISLTKQQRETVNNHFHQVKNMLEKLGHSNVQKQGSFGRGTVIQGQEKEGFDLDIAVVITDNNIFNADQLNLKIYEGLKKLYSGISQDVKIKEKAVQVDVRSNFGIDVTQIYKVGNEELVYNSYKKQFEPSYVLKFKDMFKASNASSNNALRDLARIYKHIRDAVTDVELKSLALEIILYRALKKSDTYQQTMIDTLKNFEIILKEMIKNNTYKEIRNPAFNLDFINTGIKSEDEANKIIFLNTLVIKVIENAITNDKQFHGLSRKYASISEIDKIYSGLSVIPQNKTVISGGTYGGEFLD